MGVLGYLIGLCAITIIGYLCNRLLWYRSARVLTRCEGWLISFLLGCIINSLLLFIIGRAGISYSVSHIIIYTVVLIGVLVVVNFLLKSTSFFGTSDYMSSFKKTPLWIKFVVGILTIWTLVKLVFGFVSIANVPTYQDDAYGNWNYRAKVFYYRESLVLDKNDKDFLGQGYKQYPLSPYLTKMYLMKFTGERKEGYANVITFLFYIAGLLLAFHICFRISKNTTLSLLGLYLVSSIPLLYIHGTNPYFDVFQAVYFLLAAYLVYLLLEERSSWRVAGLYIGILGFTKSEGLVIYTTAVLGGYFLYSLLYKSITAKAFRIRFLKILAVVVAVNLPFVIFKLIYGLGFGNGDASVADTQLGFHSEIFGGMSNAFFHGGSYNMLFLFLIILIAYYLLSFTKKNRSSHPALGSTRVFFYISLIGFCLVTFVYLTTFTFQYVIDQTGINRTMMQFCPIFVVALIVLLYYYLPAFHEEKK